MLLSKRPDFETRLVIAICLFGSAFVHALGVFLTYTPKPKPEAITFELVSPEDPAPEDNPGLGAVGEGEGEGEAQVAAAPAPTGWRARWRAREQKYVRDAQVHETNVALLDETARGAAGDDKPGKPLALCDRRGAHPVEVRAERDVSHWGGLVPTGLFQAAYMDGMTQVTREGSKLGAMEFALPARLARVPLDDPENAVVEVGRLDARCVVGISYSEGIFPILIRGMPARMATGGQVREAVVDLRLFQDGTFEVTPREGSLGVKRGAVYDHDSIGKKLRSFYTGATWFIPKRGSDDDR